MSEIPQVAASRIHATAATQVAAYITLNRARLAFQFVDARDGIPKLAGDPMTQHRRTGIAALIMLATACLLPAVGVAQTLDPATAAAVDKALSGTHRSDRNKARDPYRHPRETLGFFGLRRDMTVVEIWPGGGWYTEVLAPVLKGQGKLYVAQYGPHAIAPYQRDEDAALREKAKKYPDVFGKLQYTALWSPDDLAIAPAGSADLVVTFRNVHNWVNADYKLDAGKLFGAIYTALKPGGILGVVDHRWPDAKTEDPNARNGYVSEERVKALAKAAGFEFVGSSDVNRNAKDTHDHPNGVWTLLPDLSVPQGADRAKYQAIGESDRMTLKFRKPAKAK
jgi:predicted methyltransferase